MLQTSISKANIFLKINNVNNLKQNPLLFLS